MTQEEELKSANIELSGEKRLSDDISILEAEVVELTEQLEKTKQSIRDLREAEDPKTKTFYAEEIFQAQQEKLRLDVDIKFRTNKINRINLGIDEMDASDGVKGGFLF